jgi:ribosomal protein L40E
MKSKKPEDYLRITQEYNFICTECDTRHPAKLDKCFVCGSTKIEFSKVKTKKVKSSHRGATIKINI